MEKIFTVPSLGKGLMEQIRDDNRRQYDVWRLQAPKRVVDTIYIDIISKEKFRCRKDQTFQLQTDEHNPDDKQPDNLSPDVLVEYGTPIPQDDAIMANGLTILVGEKGYKEFNKSLNYIAGCDPY